MEQRASGPRRGLDRRDALRMLAAGTGTVAAGSLIVSQPAAAATGSETCTFAFTSDPQVSIRYVNQRDDRRDFLRISVSNVNGTCPCGGRRARFQYAYFVTVPGTGSGGLGWTNSPIATVSSPSVLWGDSGGSVTVEVGVQATCPDTGDGQTVRCCYGSDEIPVGAAFSRGQPSFSLPRDNSSAPGGGGLPACETSPFARSAPFLRSGGLGLVPQSLDEPPIDTTADDVVTDLGPLRPDDPTTTTTEATTTTTTSVPDTTSTTTSTTSSSTTSSSSTTTPPEPPAGD